MTTDYTDPVFAKRGIDPEVAAARGYRFWDANNAAEVMQVAFTQLPGGVPDDRLHQSGIDWCVDMAVQVLDSDVARPASGIVITRYAPAGLGLPPLMPELRPNNAVQTGPGSYHFHAEVTNPFAFLPPVVQESWCEWHEGYVVLFFEHTHRGMADVDPIGAREHMTTWHASGERHGVHKHRLEICRPSLMRAHLETSGRITNGHGGEQHYGVHLHEPRARYLFPPSRSELQEWADSVHDHARMTAPQLEYHMQRDHPDESGEQSPGSHQH